VDILHPAKHIKMPHFSGKLLIDGDFEDNCILFRFLFDSNKIVHPLLIWIKARPIRVHRSRSRRDRRDRDRIFVIECNIPDYNNPLMKSSLIFPKFLLNEHKIRVIKIESQVDIDEILKNNVKCGLRSENA